MDFAFYREKKNDRASFSAFTCNFSCPQLSCSLSLVLCLFNLPSVHFVNLQIFEIRYSHSFTKTRTIKKCVRERAWLVRVYVCVEKHRNIESESSERGNIAARHECIDRFLLHIYTTFRCRYISHLPHASCCLSVCICEFQL